ncbi:MAG: sensor histidine kinase [Gemmatimonadaceae bacterium]
MTLRLRLAFGLTAIALIFALPVLLAVRALEHMRAETARVRDQEFAATLIMGRMRENAEALSQDAQLLALFPGDTTWQNFDQRLTALKDWTDSLSRMVRPSETAMLKGAIRDVELRAPSVLRNAAAGRAATADSLLDRWLVPAMNELDRSVVLVETRLQERTRQTVEALRTEVNVARRNSAIGLVGVGVLALLISIWLARSIGRPVAALDHGMRAVAEGQFDFPLKLGGNGRDEFGRLARSFRSMATQLTELDRLRAEFLSVASHELRTPINVIQGYVQLLEEETYGPLSPAQRDVMRTLESQTESLGRLVGQLLDVGRYDAGGGKLELKAVDLDHFIQRLDDTFRVLALQKGVNLRIERAPRLPTRVLWDEDRMNEVLGNLLSNAFKFTDRGGCVTLAIRSEGDRVYMQVRDTGAGIPAQQLQFIFDKFYQADNQNGNALKGVGLGLAIAKGIVTAHGGTIGVESTVGKGTTFSINLPIRARTRPTPTSGSQPAVMEEA